MTNKEILDTQVIQIANNGIIRMHRGDTFRFPLFINIGHQLGIVKYVLEENDIIDFYILDANEILDFSEIHKSYTKDDVDEYGNIVVRLDTQDTIDMESGNYYYTAILHHLDEDGVECQYTIIPKRKFILEE